MTSYRIHAGGVLRCCLDSDFPDDPKEGDVLPCKHCKDGLRLVMYTPPPQGVGIDVGHPRLVWQAAWITLGHGWRDKAEVKSE